MFKTFENKAAVVKDDTPERLFQGWIGRRHEWAFGGEKN